MSVFVRPAKFLEELTGEESAPGSLFRSQRRTGLPLLYSRWLVLIQISLDAPTIYIKKGKFNDLSALGF